MIRKSFTGKRIKLCLLVSQLATGGSERQSFLFAKVMQLRGFDISILSLNYRCKDYWEDPISELGIQIIKVPRGNIVSRTLMIAKILRGLKIDIVQSWAFYANPYVNFAGLIAGTPVRLGAIREHPSYWQASGIIRLAELYGLNGILCNSTAAIEAVTKKYPFLPPIYFIPNIVDVPGDSDRVKLRNMLSEKYSIDISAPWIIGVGRLSKNKNWEFLIRTFKKTKAECFLIIAGQGTEISSLKDVVCNLRLEEKVRIIGEVPDISNLLPAFDIFCFSSNSEGMPNAIMEASAAGLPVISTNVGGVKDIIIDGFNGYLIQTGDEASYLEKLANLLNDQPLRIDLGSNGKNIMKEAYKSEHIADKISQLYQGVFNESQ